MSGAPTLLPPSTIPPTISETEFTSSVVQLNGNTTAADDTIRQLNDQVKALQDQLALLKAHNGSRHAQPPTNQQHAAPTQSQSTSTTFTSPPPPRHPSPLSATDDPLADELWNRVYRPQLIALCRHDKISSTINNLLDMLKPSRRIESQRLELVAFVRCLVRRSLGAQLYTFGNFAMKIYSQDEPIHLSAFFSRAHETSWIQRIVNAICGEATNDYVDDSLAQLQSTAVQHLVQRVEVDFNANIPATSTTIDSPHSHVLAQHHHASTKNTFSSGAVITANIGGLEVKIYSNQVGALASLALFEHVDRLVGKDHLLKRTIMLFKFWAGKHSVLGRREGLLSNLFLRTLVVFVFNAYHQQLSTPVEALAYILIYLKSFNFDEHALTMYGPVKLDKLDNDGVFEAIDSTHGDAWPAGVQPLIAPHVLRQYIHQARKSGSAAVHPGTGLANSASGNNLASMLPRSGSDSNFRRIGSFGQLNTQPTTAGSAMRSMSHAAISSMPRTGSLTHLTSFNQHQPASSNLNKSSMNRINSHGSLNSLPGSISQQHNHTPMHLQQHRHPQFSPLQSRDLTGLVSSISERDLRNTDAEHKVTLKPYSSTADLSRAASHSNFSLFSMPVATPAAPADNHSVHEHSDDEVSSEDDHDEHEHDDHHDHRYPINIREASAQSVHSASADTPATTPSQWLEVYNEALQLSGSAAEWQRSSVNVVDAVSPSLNLGATVSYKNQYKIRKAFSDGARALVDAGRRFLLRQEQHPNLAADQLFAVHEHPVYTELFDNDTLLKYEERDFFVHRSGSSTALNKSGSYARLGHHQASSSAIHPQATPRVSPVLHAAATPAGIDSRLTPLSRQVSATDSISSSSAETHIQMQRAASGHSTATASTIDRTTSITGLVDIDAHDKSNELQLPRSTHSTPNSSSMPISNSAPSVLSTSDAPDSADTATVPPSASDLYALPSQPTQVPGEYDNMDGNLERVLQNLAHARQFETPDISETELVELVRVVLTERGSVPIGRLGSLLHEATNNHSLPAMLKEQFGGLKRLLERHPDVVHILKNHPYNPTVKLRQPPIGTQQSTAQATSSADNAANGSRHPASSAGLSADNDAVYIDDMLDDNTGVGTTRRKAVRRHRVRTRRTPHSNTLGVMSTGGSGQVIGATNVEQDGENVLHTSEAAEQTTGEAPAVAATGHTSISSTHTNGHATAMGNHAHHHHNRPTLTSMLALDCEFVGVSSSGLRSILARVSIVNYHGEVVFDRYVLPTEPVTDYRTNFSGITPQHLDPTLNSNLVEFKQVQREVSQTLKHRTLIGHGITADLQSLFLVHPRRLTRDTAHCRLLCPVKPLPLKKLMQTRLGLDIQENVHDSIEDARAALMLYKTVQHEWEQLLSQQSAMQQPSHNNGMQYAHQHQQHMQHYAPAAAYGYGFDQGAPQTMYQATDYYNAGQMPAYVQSGMYGGPQSPINATEALLSNYAAAAAADPSQYYQPSPAPSQPLLPMQQHPTQYPRY